MKDKFYRLKNILAKNALYNVIFGERSNGKSFAVHEYAIERYIRTGEQLAIVRRWDTDFIGKRGATMFDGIVGEGVIDRITGGKWNSVHYYASRWYLSRIENGQRVEVDDTPFAYGFALTMQEHDKSTAYPNITTVLFDEFISRGAYIPDEFTLFMNVLSTIIRHRTNVKIFMLGNTVNKYACPYFAEMGLKHIKQMRQGDIDVYQYGDSGLTVAVEYTAPNVKGKPSDVYFAFDNPKLKMITGGEWEIALYPHCPVKFKPKDIKYIYFIIFEEITLQCEIVYFKKNDEVMNFTFIHPKTTPLKKQSTDLIYSLEFSPRPNWKRNITKPRTRLEKIVAEYFITDKVFYSDNETGEVVRNYLISCGKGVE